VNDGSELSGKLMNWEGLLELELVKSARPILELPRNDAPPGGLWLVARR